MDEIKLNIISESGKRLSDLMKSKRITNKMLAEMSGVTISRISQHRSGVHLMSLYDAVQVAAALKTTIDYLSAIDMYIAAKNK